MLDIFFLFLAFCCSSVHDFLFALLFILMWAKLYLDKYKSNTVSAFLNSSIQTFIICGTVFAVMQIINYSFIVQSFSNIHSKEINKLFPYLHRYKNLHVNDAFPSDHAALASCLLLVVSPLLSQKMGIFYFLLCIPALFARLFFGFHSIWDMLGSVFITYAIVFTFRFSKFAKYVNHFSKYMSNSMLKR